MDDPVAVACQQKMSPPFISGSILTAFEKNVESFFLMVAQEKLDVINDEDDSEQELAESVNCNHICISDRVAELLEECTPCWKQRFFDQKWKINGK